MIDRERSSQDGSGRGTYDNVRRAVEAVSEAEEPGYEILATAAEH